ncbi:MAG: hypothetical protein EP332_12535 [Bacteroidetes bacterium]|nr:MAG: hypothetical protein EP332_12535 [Bacteroidota bacterium]
MQVNQKRILPLLLFLCFGIALSFFNKVEAADSLVFARLTDSSKTYSLPLNNYRLETTIRVTEGPKINAVITGYRDSMLYFNSLNIRNRKLRTEERLEDLDTLKSYITEDSFTLHYNVLVYNTPDSVHLSQIESIKVYDAHVLKYPKLNRNLALISVGSIISLVAVPYPYVVPVTVGTLSVYIYREWKSNQRLHLRKRYHLIGLARKSAD